MKTASLVLAIFLALGVANAEIITIEVSATITTLEDNGSNGGYFGGNISLGDTLVMTYSYDTKTPDSDPRTNYGVYYQSIPNMLSINVGCYTFQSNMDNLDYHIGILQGTTGDSYNVLSTNNIILQDIYPENFRIYMQLNYDINTFEDTNLTAIAPDMTPLGVIRIDGRRDFYIVATPTFIEIIPEPMTLLLFGLGGLILSKSCKHKIKGQTR